MSFDPTASAAAPTGGEGSPASLESGAAADRFFQLGYDRLYADDPAGAARAFAAVAVFDPASGEAWAALGEGAASADDPVRAAVAYDRAVAVDAGVWPWRLGRADALFRAGQTSDSVTAFESLASERPDAAMVRLGLARALAAAGEKGRAVDEYREAVALRSGDRDAALELAALLIETDDALGAVELLQPIARRDSDDPALHHAIGRAWMALREPAKALVALRRARDLDPDDRLGTAGLIAALEAGEGADLSNAYVRALFDRYADRFDQDLVGKLGYAAPELLRAAIDRTGVDQAGSGAGLRVFDLGCGTGLAGVVFRPLAAHLAGVDLSPRMIDKARARGLYDALIVGDVVDSLSPGREPWDLLVAADVLVYIGDLAPVFAAAGAALRPGGRFAATVERLDGEGFALGPSRRYAHAESYVRKLAAETGLAVRLLEPCTPRREKGVPVPGLLFVLEKVARPAS